MPPRSGLACRMFVGHAVGLRPIPVSRLRSHQVQAARLHRVHEAITSGCARAVARNALDDCDLRARRQLLQHVVRSQHPGIVVVRRNAGQDIDPRILGHVRRNQLVHVDDRYTLLRSLRQRRVQVVRRQRRHTDRIITLRQRRFHLRQLLAFSTSIRTITSW
jgi:hypothetical protein